MKARSALAVLAVLMSSCTGATPPGAEPVQSTTALDPGTTTTTPTTTTTTTSTTTTTTTLPPTFDVTVAVADPDGNPLADAVVTIDDQSTTTGNDGLAGFTSLPAEPIEVTRPGWLATESAWTGEAEVTVRLEPRIVRGLRVAKYVAADPAQFADLLELAANSTINTLVFDTKDETGDVLYESSSEFAAAIGSVAPMYDPAELLSAAKDAGLYTITRIVTFEDPTWVRERPDHKLAGSWVDPTNPGAWEYPIELAAEACNLGFEEIQFDYVRFPAGRTAEVARERNPTTQEDRTGALRAFLSEARDRIHPLGCAVSADLFAIVLSSPDDQGIGQMPETVSGVLDAVSPMIYPSHYSDGWLGFPEPNDHPGPVVADALDSGMPRLSGGTLMRPWLQAFYYSGEQVLAQINEAEARGIGWILWNAAGNYSASSLPALEK